MIAPTAAIMRGRADVKTMEAFSRAAVGTTGLILAARMDQERQDRGLESTQLDVGGGTSLIQRMLFLCLSF